MVFNSNEERKNHPRRDKIFILLQKRIMNLDLIGKVALVAGSTQGIGKQSAIELSKMGAKVILLARNEEKLKASLKDLDNSLGQEHEYISADFSKPDELEKKIKEYIGKGNIVNILVNNTGGPAGGKAIEAKTSEYLSAFQQHLICNQILASNLSAGMISSKYGRIINIISTSVKAPLKDLGVSNTVRGAVANWAKTLSVELGPYGITVNNVLPGATNTSRLKEIISNKAVKTGKTEAIIAAEMASAVPMGRVAEPSEIAHAVAFLASPSASYINGINLPVDGGRTPSL